MSATNTDAHEDNVVAQLREMGAHLAKEGSDATSRAAASLAHAAADLAEQVKKQATPVIQKAGKEVREHPVSTAAILAASIGLIGYAFAKSRHHAD